MDDFGSNYQLDEAPATKRGVTFEVNSDGAINHNTCNTSVEEMFQPAGSNFMDDLDFLENCGSKSDSAEEIQRKSLYVKFDPLCLSSPGALPSKIGGDCSRNPSASAGNALALLGDGEAASNGIEDVEIMTKLCAEENVQNDSMNAIIDPIFHSQNIRDLSTCNTSDLAATVSHEQNVTVNQSLCNNFDAVDEVPNNQTLNISLTEGSLDPLTQTMREIDEMASNGHHLIDPFSQNQNNLESTSVSHNVGLVEPLLYTQSDIDDSTKKVRSDCEEEMRAVVCDWQKRFTELQNQRKEELSKRDLVEKENFQSTESLKKECLDMRQVLSQYERTIHEIAESSHKEKLMNEEANAESIHAKDSLEKDLSTAEQNLFDAYKRVEKLKQTFDSLKQNEEKLVQNSGELIKKIEASENKYDKLRTDALAKIDVANEQFAKLRKQQEIDTAGVQAALKMAQSKSNNLELEIKQKNVENAQLHQICDDLIKKVSGS